MCQFEDGQLEEQEVNWRQTKNGCKKTCQGNNTIESGKISQVRSTYRYMCFDNV
jgi:hypothetical protein